MKTFPRLGLGAGWRPELALAIDRRHDLGFVEVVAESLSRSIPTPLLDLRARGMVVIPHGVGLSLASAAPPDPARLDLLARLSRTLDAPFVSEHLAFVRGGGIESGHLLPPPRSRESLEIVCQNVATAQSRLPVPLVLENVAALFGWSDDILDEATFVGEILERTGCGFLLDLANLHANVSNFGGDAVALLERLPLERLAYVHVAGGVMESDGFYRDTHAHAVPPPVLDLVEALAERCEIPALMLERDDRFPPEAQWAAELDALGAAWRRGRDRRAPGDPPPPILVPPSQPATESTAALRVARATVEARVLHALLADGPVPAELDRTEVVRARRALVRKRARIAADAAPELARSLGTRWDSAFASWAAQNPATPESCGHSDARAFAATLSLPRRAGHELRQGPAGPGR